MTDVIGSDQYKVGVQKSLGIGKWQIPGMEGLLFLSMYEVLCECSHSC